jgi:ankyrin repeat protein
MGKTSYSDKIYTELSAEQNEIVLDKNGDTPLICAIKTRNKCKALSLLKDYKNQNIGYINKDGDTALILACLKNMNSVALKLLEYPELCNIRNIDKKGNTALIWANTNKIKEINDGLLELKKRMDRMRSTIYD